MKSIKSLGMSKAYQWTYQLDDCPLWSITDFYMTKSEFVRYIEEFNKTHHKPIVNFKKIKPTLKLRIDDN